MTNLGPIELGEALLEVPVGTYHYFVAPEARSGTKWLVCRDGDHVLDGGPLVGVRSASVEPFEFCVIAGFQPDQAVVTTVSTDTESYMAETAAGVWMVEMRRGNRDMSYSVAHLERSGKVLDEVAYELSASRLLGGQRSVRIDLPMDRRVGHRDARRRLDANTELVTVLRPTMRRGLSLVNVSRG